MIIVGSAGLSMLAMGTALAYAAEFYVAQAETLEVAAGLLIVGGLGLIGVAMNGAFPAGFLVR